MTDPEYLNDLKEMPIGFAARAAFGHAAEAAGLTPDVFHPLHVEFYSLLVLTVGETCTDQHVSAALHLAGDQIGEGDAVNIAFAEYFLLAPTREVNGEPVPIPVEKFVRQAAAALAALNKFEPDERVLVGRPREIATPAVIVSRGSGEREWLVADKPGGTTRTTDAGDIWRAPLAQPTPLRGAESPVPNSP